MWSKEDEIDLNITKQRLRRNNTHEANYLEKHSIAMDLRYHMDHIVFSTILSLELPGALYANIHLIVEYVLNTLGEK